MRCWANNQNGKRCQNKTKGRRFYCHTLGHKEGAKRKFRRLLFITIPAVASSYIGIYLFFYNSKTETEKPLSYAEKLDAEQELDTVEIAPHSDLESQVEADSLTNAVVTNSLKHESTKATLEIVKISSPQTGLLELQLLNPSEGVILLSDIQFNDTLSSTSANFFRNNTKVYRRIISTGEVKNDVSENTTFAFKRPIAIAQEIAPKSGDRFSIELQLENSLVRQSFIYNGTITLYYNGTDSLVSQPISFKIK